MSYRKEVLRDSPAAYWRLNETAGATAADSSGNGNTINVVASTYAQASLIVNDPNSYAMQFNGTSEGNYTTSYLAFVNDSVRTFEGWFNVTDGTALNMLFASGNDTNQGAAYLTTGGEFGIAATTILWAPAGNVGNGGTTATWLSAIADNATFHMALTHDDANRTAELFINGVSQGAKTGLDKYINGNNLYTDLGFWRQTATNIYFYQGKLQEAAVYNSILSSTRIQAHYYAGVNYAQGVFNALPQLSVGDGMSRSDRW